MMHKKTHTEKKPYENDQKKKSHSYNDDFIHYQKNSASEQLFEYNICGKAFHTHTQKQPLLHIRTHTRRETL